MQDVTLEIINQIRTEMRESIWLTPDVTPAFQDVDKYPMLAQEVRNIVDDLAVLGLDNPSLNLIEDCFVALVSMIHRANQVSQEVVTKVPVESMN